MLKSAPLPIKSPVPTSIGLFLVYTRESYLKNQELQSAFIVARQIPVPMDLVAVDLSSGKRLYSFLSIGWGMMADVDIESDRYRTLGGSRFALMAVIKIAGQSLPIGLLVFIIV